MIKPVIIDIELEANSFENVTLELSQEAQELIADIRSRNLAEFASYGRRFEGQGCFGRFEPPSLMQAKAILAFLNISMRCEYKSFCEEETGRYDQWYFEVMRFPYGY